MFAKISIINKKFTYLILIFLSCFPNNLLACKDGKINLPKELYYEGDVISPYCITKRGDNNIIDLAECKKALAQDDRPYETYCEHDILYTRFDYPTGDNGKESENGWIDRDSWESSSMQYIGIFDSQMILKVGKTYFTGTGFYYPLNQMLAFKREGDKLIIRGIIYGQEEGTITDSNIKDGVLYFTELINRRSMWSAILDGAGIKYNKHGYEGRIVMSYAENEEEYCGAAFFHLDKLVINPEDPKKHLPPIKPDKVEFEIARKGSIYEETLEQIKPAEVYEGYCTSLPYYETYFEYTQKGKRILIGKDFEEFVNIVRQRCNKIKKDLSSK